MTRIATWNSARDVWETEAVSLLSGRSDVFSGIFPISGMTVNGVAYELPTSAHHTDGSGSLFSQLGGKLLTTPTTTQRGTDANLETREGARANLHNEVIELLKTPTAQLAINGGSQHPDKRKAGGHGPTLADEVEHLLPTPKAGDADFGMPRTSGRPPEKSTHLMTRMEYTKPAESWGPYAAAIARWESVLGRPAPEPTEEGPKGGRRLSAAFVEWMMGLPEGWVTGHGLPRTAELKMLGNGVVPQQAIAALREMVS